MQNFELLLVDASFQKLEDYKLSKVEHSCSRHTNSQFEVAALEICATYKLPIASHISYFPLVVMTLQHFGGVSNDNVAFFFLRVTLFQTNRHSHLASRRLQITCTLKGLSLVSTVMLGMQVIRSIFTRKQTFCSPGVTGLLIKLAANL
jgi:hypothetical protein